MQSKRPECSVPVVKCILCMTNNCNCNPGLTPMYSMHTHMFIYLHTHIMYACEYFYLAEVWMLYECWVILWCLIVWKHGVGSCSRPGDAGFHSEMSNSLCTLKHWQLCVYICLDKCPKQLGRKTPMIFSAALVFCYNGLMYHSSHSRWWCSWWRHS